MTFQPPPYILHRTRMRLSIDRIETSKSGANVPWLLVNEIRLGNPFSPNDLYFTENKNPLYVFPRDVKIVLFVTCDSLILKSYDSSPQLDTRHPTPSKSRKGKMTTVHTFYLL